MQKNLTRDQVLELMPLSFKNFLYSQQCLKAYVINLLDSYMWLSLDTDYITQYKEIKKLFNLCPQHIIMASFSWKETTQGYQYWELIYQRAVNIIKPHKTN